MADEIEWRTVSPQFGAGMPYGSCNAYVPEDGTVCGYPRRKDGTCFDGHPAQPDVDVPEGTEIPFRSDGSFGLPTEGVLVIKHMPAADDE